MLVHGRRIYSTALVIVCLLAPSAAAEFRSNLTGWMPVAKGWMDSPTGLQGHATGATSIMAREVGSDFTYECTMTIASGAAGGLIIRAKDNPDEGGYMVYLASGDPGVVQLHRVPYKNLAQYKTRIERGRRYRLKVEAEGPRIRVFLDKLPRPVIEVEDGSHKRGRVGLRVWRATAVFHEARIAGEFAAEAPPTFPFLPFSGVQTVQGTTHIGEVSVAALKDSLRVAVEGRALTVKKADVVPPSQSELDAAIQQGLAHLRREDDEEGGRLTELIRFWNPHLDKAEALFDDWASVEQSRNRIAEIEALPKTARLVEYTNALRGRVIADPLVRQRLISALARHAFFCSPQYGNSRIPIPAALWQQLFDEARQRNPENTQVALALTRILIERGRYKEALDVITPPVKMKKGGHAALAWQQWAKKKLEAPETLPGGREFSPPEFDVHFCVVTRNPQAHQIATPEQLKREVDILNAKFRGLANQKLVHFRFKSASFYNDVKNLGCKFVALDGQPYSSDGWATVFNQCRHHAVRDPSAINFFVFDARASGGASHGKRNSNRPYLLIGWERLGNRGQNPEPHEMGHAFGLDHTGVPRARGRDFTNIMCSRSVGLGSGCPYRKLRTSCHHTTYGDRPFRACEVS